MGLSVRDVAKDVGGKAEKLTCVNFGTETLRAL